MPRRPRNSEPNEDEVEELLAPMSESGALKRKFDFTRCDKMPPHSTYCITLLSQTFSSSYFTSLFIFACSALGVEKIARKVRKLSRKEEETWNKTSADIRTQCVKTIVR